MFVKSAGFVLLMAALSRFLIALEPVPFLLLPDPALGIPLRYSLLVAGGIELLFALICLFGKNIYFQTGWLVWLATNYVVFQIGLFWMHCHPQATCVGSLTDPLHLSRGFYGWITTLLRIYLVLGSYIAVISLLIAPKRNELPVAQSVGQSNFIKMSCVLCDGHIEFPAYAIGQKISCPHCAKPITLLSPA